MPAAQMWGHSLAVRIPRTVADQAGIKPGTLVDLAVEDGRIIVTPIRVAALTLDGLLAAVTNENVHGAFPTGTPVGNEAW
jgi:antitoxin MazE